MRRWKKRGQMELGLAHSHLSVCPENIFFYSPALSVLICKMKVVCYVIPRLEFPNPMISNEQHLRPNFDTHVGLPAAPEEKPKVEPVSGKMGWIQTLGSGVKHIRVSAAPRPHSSTCGFSPSSL